MEILGLLDSLEEAILNGVKIPLTKKILLNEEEILTLIDKIRLVAQGGSNFAKKAIDKDRSKVDSEPLPQNQQTIQNIQQEQPMIQEFVSDKNKAAEIIQNAYQLAKEIREGADKYADEILSNLELTSTRILRTIKAGRDRLEKNVQGEKTSNE